MCTTFLIALQCSRQFRFKQCDENITKSVCHNQGKTFVYYFMNVTFYFTTDKCFNKSLKIF